MNQFSEALPQFLLARDCFPKSLQTNSIESIWLGLSYLWLGVACAAGSEIPSKQKKSIQWEEGFNVLNNLTLKTLTSDPTLLHHIITSLSKNSHLLFLFY